MKSIRIAAAALIAAGVATPALASGNPASTTTNAAATTTADNSRAQNNRRVCVRVQLTGSRIERMQCQTRAEWLRQEGAVPGEQR